MQNFFCGREETFSDVRIEIMKTKSRDSSTFERFICLVIVLLQCIISWIYMSNTALLYSNCNPVKSFFKLSRLLYISRVKHVYCLFEIAYSYIGLLPTIAKIVLFPHFSNWPL